MFLPALRAFHSCCLRLAWAGALLSARPRPFGRAAPPFLRGRGSCAAPLCDQSGRRRRAVAARFRLRGESGRRHAAGVFFRGGAPCAPRPPEPPFPLGAAGGGGRRASCRARSGGAGVGLSPAAPAATFRARPVAAARSLASRAPQLIMLKKRKELLKVPLAPF